MTIQEANVMESEQTEGDMQQMGFPAFIMSLYFWLIWVNPLIFDDVLRGCALILIIEFLTVHSTVFIVFVAKEKVSMWLLLIYIVAVVIAAGATRTIWPIPFFAWHIYDTMKAFRNASEGQIKTLWLRWFVTIVLFLLAIMPAVVLPLPDLGWHHGIVSSDFAWREEGSSRLNYHVTPAWGTIYFFLIGMMSLYWPVICANLKNRVNKDSENVS
ncbi:MAG: hypothetical protein PHR77_11065 [Kiritimatiellae bacterium]|nr:hypothetical protein [Kiritimatiellia bacterium]MDD5523111.1 hypothetical protein [Kiritimatiellia bacterium]